MTGKRFTLPHFIHNSFSRYDQLTAPNFDHLHCNAVRKTSIRNLCLSATKDSSLSHNNNLISRFLTYHACQQSSGAQYRFQWCPCVCVSVNTNAENLLTGN